RGDIVKAMTRALAARGQERALGTFDLHGEETRTPIVGRLIDKQLTDELGDRIGVVIDGVDGRVHHVALRESSAAEEAPIGSIAEAGGARPQRPADHNGAEVAGGTGEYRSREHRAFAEATNLRAPGVDYDA